MCQNSFLYFISTLLTIRYRTFGFTLDIQIKVCLALIYQAVTLYFISTPYNRLPTCVWFNLRYK